MRLQSIKTVHQNTIKTFLCDYNLIRCFSLSASQYSGLIRSQQATSERPQNLHLHCNGSANESYYSYNLHQVSDPFADPNILKDRLLFAIPKKGALYSLLIIELFRLTTAIHRSSSREMPRAPQWYVIPTSFNELLTYIFNRRRHSVPPTESS